MVLTKPSKAGDPPVRVFNVLKQNINPTASPFLSSVFFIRHPSPNRGEDSAVLWNGTRVTLGEEAEGLKVITNTCFLALTVSVPYLQLSSTFSEQQLTIILTSAQQRPSPDNLSGIHIINLSPASVFTCKMIWVVLKLLFIQDRTIQSFENPSHFWGYSYKSVTSDLPEGGPKKWISPLGPLRCHKVTRISDSSMSQHLYRAVSDVLNYILFLNFFSSQLSSF